MDQRFEYKRQHPFFSEFLRYLEEFGKKRINLPHSAAMDHVKVLTLASHLSLQLSRYFCCLGHANVRKKHKILRIQVEGCSGAVQRLETG